MSQNAFETEFNGLTRAQPSLPATWYFDAEHYAREMNAIWRQEWVCVGPTAGLEESGAFRVIELAGDQLLAIRGDDGELRVVHNTCRHRGSRLCTASSGRFDNGRIVCPYHQWSYHLDGSLAATGRMRPVAGFAREDYPLYSVATRQWGGLLFVSLAENPPDFDAHFGVEMERLARWPLDQLKVGWSYRTTLQCNWKAFWENFNECLHCPNVHPELCQLVPLYGRGIMEPEDDPSRTDMRSDDPRFTGGLRDGAESWTPDGQRCGPTFDTLSEDDRARGHTYAVLMPSVFVVGHLDHARVVRLKPIGPEETELCADWLFPATTLEDPHFDPAATASFATQVMEEDGSVCEINQLGLRCSRHTRGVLMQEEYEVFAFHEWVRERLGEV